MNSFCKLCFNILKDAINIDNNNLHIKQQYFKWNSCRNDIEFVINPINHLNYSIERKVYIPNDASIDIMYHSINLSALNHNKQGEGQGRSYNKLCSY